jgi:hypothetical protein
LAKQYEIAYAELYPPDFMPVDTGHRMVEAFTQEHGAASGVPGFVGFRPWLKSRTRTLYVREGKVRQTYNTGGRARGIDRLMIAAAVPSSTWVRFRARTRTGDGQWSDWRDSDHVRELPAGTEAEVEATLHTDDGYFTPRVISMTPQWR